MKTTRKNHPPGSHREFSTIEPLESRIAPATIIVTSLGDTPVTGKTDLRQALAQADADLVLHPGVVNTILFKVPAAAAHTENIIALTGGVLTSMGDVKIVGPGSGKLIVSGGGASQVFKFSGSTATVDSPVSISGLSIIGGNTAGGGAGVLSTESLTLKNVVISENTDTTGSGAGGVQVNGNATAGTKVNIINSLISGNSGGGEGGGGFYTIKSFNISNTVITGNTAIGGGSGGMYIGVDSTGTGGTISGCHITGNSGGYAGGIHVSDANTAATSKITISGTNFAGNTSSLKSVRASGGLLVEAGNTVITGSTFQNNSSVYDGGGITARAFTSLTISKSVISGNKTTATNASGQGGGGLFIQGSASGPLLPVQISKSVISDNRSVEDGGGAFASGGVALTVTRSVFSGNNAGSNGVTSSGGGLRTTGSGTATLTTSVFSNNTADHGGGINAVGDSSFSLTACKLTGNTAANGGGFYGNSITDFTLKNAVITGNTSSGIGGGLNIAFISNAVVSGGAITGNQAATYGGGVYFFDSTASILGTVISGNVANNGGGVFNATSTAGAVTLQIAKVLANSAATGPDVNDTPGDLSTFKFV